MQAAKTLLDQAYQTISGDRRASYGDVSTSFDRVAKCWSAILNQPITASQVCLCMAALKLCREANAPKQDNRMDAVGYLALLEELESGKATTTPVAQPTNPTQTTTPTKPLTCPTCSTPAVILGCGCLHCTNCMKDIWESPNCNPTSTYAS